MNFSTNLLVFSRWKMLVQSAGIPGVVLDAELGCTTARIARADGVIDKGDVVDLMDRYLVTGRVLHMPVDIDQADDVEVSAALGNGALSALLAPAWAPSAERLSVLIEKAEALRAMSMPFHDIALMREAGVNSTFPVIGATLCRGSVVIALSHAQVDQRAATLGICIAATMFGRRPIGNPRTPEESGVAYVIFLRNGTLRSITELQLEAQFVRTPFVMTNVPTAEEVFGPNPAPGIMRRLEPIFDAVPDCSELQAFATALSAGQKPNANMTRVIANRFAQTY